MVGAYTHKGNAHTGLLSPNDANLLYILSDQISLTRILPKNKTKNLNMKLPVRSTQFHQFVLNILNIIIKKKKEKKKILCSESLWLQAFYETINRIRDKGQC